jgi:TonB family protein
MSEEYRGQLAEVPMTEAWKRWQGQTVNGEFPLGEYVGGSAHGAVFLTEYDHQPAAIRLISANSPDKDRQLASWQLATELSHPNLTRVFQVGLCHLEGEELFYAVTEFADENLAQILAQRPLTVEETAEMLKPALDALIYLHKRDLVHGAVIPANIGAKGDQLKLSTDSLVRAGEPNREPGSYAPPESSTSPASDVWSLGMTLVEVFTQHLPSWQLNTQADPDVPKDLPAPLSEVVGHCLLRNPSQRWTAEEIANHLNPAAIRPSPAPSVSAPIGERAVAEPPQPSMAAPPAAVVTSSPSAPRQSETRQRAVAPKKRSNLVPVAIAFVLVASLLGIELITRSPKPAAKAVPEAETPAQSSVPAAVQQQPKDVPAPKAEEPIPSVRPDSSRPSTAESRVETREASAADLTADQSPSPAVVRQVMPDVAKSAQRSIRGTVRVGIKASVDASGNVTDATIDSPGPSRYFANAALQAARQWKFEPGGKSAGDWLLRFAFRTDGIQATAKLANP